MSLTLFTRHTDDCPSKSKGRFYTRCGCPFHVQGRTETGKYLRQSLGTNDANEAQRELDRLDKGLDPVAVPTGEGKTIEAGKKEFLAELKTRNLTGRTIYKYEFLFAQLDKFAAAKKFTVLRQFDKDAVLAFRAEWTESAHTKQKKFERLRQVFKFAHESGWIDRNPTTGVKAIRFHHEAKEAFTGPQMSAILAAAAKKITETNPQGKANALRLRALVLFLRYSGLRIGDATSAEVASLADGKLSRYTQKSQNTMHVYIELPPEVTRALAEIPKASERYWFWSGNGKIETAAKDWQARLAELFIDAKMPKGEGHAHRFRHTFAHAHLTAGGSMEDLSRLLGHTSIKVTEKYYAKWSVDRQKRAGEALQRTWVNDPVLAWERAGSPAPVKVERAEEEKTPAVPSTRQVRENRKAVN